MLCLPEPLASTAHQQHARLTRQQIVAQIGESRLRALLAAGVLVHDDHRGIYRIAGARSTRTAELAGLLLRLGRDAVAAGATTLGLFQIAPYKLEAPFHVAIPAERRVRNPGCTVLHTLLPDNECTTKDDIATMRVARAVLMLARSGLDTEITEGVAKPVTVRATIDEAFRRDVSSFDELLGIAQSHPNDPGAAAVRSALLDGTFSQANDAERRLAKLFRPGDPQPRWQVWVLPDVRADGAMLEARMVLEYQSRQWHLQAGDQDRDSSRMLKLSHADILTVTVTAGMLRDEREETRRRILETYERQVAAGVEPIVPFPPPSGAR